MTTRRVATRAWVATPRGPVAAGRLRAGDAVLVLGRDGRLARSSVKSTMALGAGTCVRLFTDVGDLVVPAEEPVLTTTGPLPAVQVVTGLAAARRSRVEVLREADLAEAAGWPPLRRGRGGTRQARATLQALGRTHAVVPAGVAPAVAPLIEKTLKAADVEWAREDDDRWRWWTWASQGEPALEAAPAEPDADALLALTTWTDGSSRTTVPEESIRQALLSALLREGRPARVTWMPGYFPAEARVSEQRLPAPYANVVTTQEEHVDILELELDRPGAVACGRIPVGRLI